MAYSCGGYRTDRELVVTRRSFGARAWSFKTRDVYCLVPALEVYYNAWSWQLCLGLWVLNRKFNATIGFKPSKYKVVEDKTNEQKQEA